MNKDIVNSGYIKKYIWIRTREGFISMKYSYAKTICFFMLTMFLLNYSVTQLARLCEEHFDLYEWLNFGVTVILLFPILEAVLLIAYSKPIKAWNSWLCFMRAGLTNSVGEPPILLTYSNLSGDNVLFTFTSQGIALEDWEKHRLAIENAFDITISGFKHGKNMREVHMLAFVGKYDYSRVIPWDDVYFDPKSPIIALGEAMGVTVEMSLATYPHMLIGGSTNCGKTRLMQLILKQCHLKGYEVCLADFKGAVDYPQSWRNKIRIIDNTSELIMFLETLECEIHRRKNVFIQKMCRDIEDFMKRYPGEMNRIILAVDEVAELLDAEGLSKEEKQIVQFISHRLATVARLGRAFGIHLVLSTQRPDANVISGQIKNNINYRICGRADSILSKIILDNTDASTLIPHDSQGVFLNQDGEIFKAYFFDEEL